MATEIDPLKLIDAESRKSYEGREYRGYCTLQRDYSAEEEKETNASDAISDILTHVVGIAGHTTWREGETATVHHHDYEMNEARALLERAFESWMGDAEDYCVKLD